MYNMAFRSRPRRARRQTKPRRWRKPGMARKRRIQPKVYHFKRSLYTQAALVNGNSGIQTAFYNTLNAVPNYTEFTALYDQYMIKKIVTKIIPRFTEVGQTQTNNPGFNVHSIIDINDNAPPANVQELVQYQNYKMTRGDRIHTRVYCPAVETGVQNTAVATSWASAKKFQWIDCAVTAIPHFGMKIVMDPTPVTGQTASYDVLTTFYMAFKNVK